MASVKKLNEDVETDSEGTGTELEKRPNSVLFTDEGRTVIAETVVEKIAGLAAREVRGVHTLGTGSARALGALRERVPGRTTALGVGVTVEVGERQAAVDLDLVIEYDIEIVELSQAVRRNVIDSIERMTGLQVTEVNINITDVFIPGDDEPDEARVQ